MPRQMAETPKALLDAANLHLSSPFILTGSLVTATSDAFADASPNQAFDIVELPADEVASMQPQLQLQLHTVGGT